MKIVFINDKLYPEKTGVGSYALSLAEEYRRDGHEVFFITATKNKKQKGRDEIGNFSIYRIYTKFSVILSDYLTLYNPFVIKKIRKIFLKNNYDVAHFFNIHSAISYHALKVSKKFNKLTIWNARDTMAISPGKFYSFVDQKKLDIQKEFDYKIKYSKIIKDDNRITNPFRNILIRKYLRYADLLITNNNEVKKALEQNRIDNLITIYSGIDTKEFNIAPGAINKFKDRYGLKNKKILFFNGRLSYLKGLSHVIKSLESLIRFDPAIILLVAGERNLYVSEIENKLAERKILDNIIFTGWLGREEIIKSYLSSDICLSLSIYLDAFPKVNLEAMAAKKPVIGTCFGGTPEAVVDGVTGYIVNPLNVKMLADRIIDLLKNPEKARQFGEAGYQRVKEKFNLEDKAKETLAIYEKYLSRKN